MTQLLDQRSRFARWALLCLLSCASASAGGVGVIASEPAAVPAGTTTTITITAVISDPALIPGSVQLQTVDADGKVAAVNGLMHDDGLAGDAAANDGVFSLRLAVSPKAVGVMLFRVSAALKGSLTRVVSTPFVVRVTGTTGLAIGPLGRKLLATSDSTVYSAIFSETILLRRSYVGDGLSPEQELI